MRLTGKGSPPHTRGRSEIRLGNPLGIRFTPAYAGKIVNDLPPSWNVRVHPRIRGEDQTCRPPSAGSPGSPPHTRGRSGLPQSGSDAEGFTPAYAGKMPSGMPRTRRGKVHPRIRGEDLRESPSKSAWDGSPPHTRGRLNSSGISIGNARFTPAYAGKIVNGFHSSAL